MYSDLPPELRTMVYARLHVADRFRLNQALPAQVPELDRRLAAMWRMFRHGRVDPASVPNRVLQFMCENREDPTVVDIVATHGVVLPEAQSKEGDAFMRRLKRGIATAADVSDDVVNSHEFVARLLNSFHVNPTPAAYDLITHDARICRAMASHQHRWNAGGLIPDMMCSPNPSPAVVATLAHLCARKDDPASNTCANPRSREYSRPASPTCGSCWTRSTCPSTPSSPC